MFLIFCGICFLALLSRAGTYAFHYPDNFYFQAGYWLVNWLFYITLIWLFVKSFIG